MKRIAAIDIGGNDVKLLINMIDYDGDVSHVVLPLNSFPTGFRFAVDFNGNLKKEQYDKTINALETIKHICDENMVDEIRITSCSAAREMNPYNQKKFQKDVKTILKYPVHIITGNIEAQLGFKGALLTTESADDNDNMIVTIDVGGGSTELAIGSNKTGAVDFQSIPLGGNTLKLMLSSMNEHDIDGILKLIHDKIHDEIKPVFKIANHAHNMELMLTPSLMNEDNTLITEDDDPQYVIIGGAATTLSAWLHGLNSTDPFETDGYTDDTMSLISAARTFSKLTDDERLESGCVLKGRESSIWCSALIIVSILTELGATSAMVSAHGLIDAIINDKSWKFLLSKEI